MCGAGLFLCRIFGFAKNGDFWLCVETLRMYVAWLCVDVLLVLLDGAVFVRVIALVGAGCVCGRCGDV